MLTGRHGWQAFGSAGVSGNYFTVEGNVWVRNGEMFGQWVRGIQIVPTSTVIDTEILENYSWYSPNFGNHRVEIGSTGLVVRNNRFAGELSLELREPLSNATIEGNRFYSKTQIDAGPGFEDVTLPDNEYGPGTGVEVFVRENHYEPDRLLAVVFNWDQAPLAAVDLDGQRVRAGDVLKVWSAEDLYGEPRVFSYGGRLELPMMGWTVASPAGMTALPSALPKFGVFVIRVEKAYVDDPGHNDGSRDARKAARLAGWRRPASKVEQDLARENRSGYWQLTVGAGMVG
jgi:hypothetical protein